MVIIVSSSWSNFDKRLRVWIGFSQPSLYVKVDYSWCLSPFHESGHVVIILVDGMLCMSFPCAWVCGSMVHGIHAYNKSHYKILHPEVCIVTWSLEFCLCERVNGWVITWGAIQWCLQNPLHSEKNVPILAFGMLIVYGFTFLLYIANKVGNSMLPWDSKHWGNIQTWGKMAPIYIKIDRNYLL